VKQKDRQRRETERQIEIVKQKEQVREREGGKEGDRERGREREIGREGDREIGRTRLAAKRVGGIKYKMNVGWVEA